MSFFFTLDQLESHQLCRFSNENNSSNHFQFLLNYLILHSILTQIYQVIHPWIQTCSFVYKKIRWNNISNISWTVLYKSKTSYNLSNITIFLKNKLFIKSLIYPTHQLTIFFCWRYFFISKLGIPKKEFKFPATKTKRIRKGWARFWICLRYP